VVRVAGGGGPGRKLRARTPDLARQELWAYLIIYQALRAIAAYAAAGTRGLDPGRISFTATLPAARRTITTARHDMHPALAHTGTEIPSALIPRRDRRISVRAVKQTRSPRTCKASHQSPKHTTPPAPPPPPARPTPPSLTSANKPQKNHRTPLRFLALRPRDSKVHNAVAHWRATRPHRPGSLRTAAILAGMK